MPARLSASLALALAVLALPAAAAERAEIPEKYKWNLADLYPSPEAWRASRNDLDGRIPSLAGHRGHLGDSAEALWRALDAATGLERDLARLLAYAGCLSDQDVRAAGPRELRQEAEALRVKLASASSFLEPEILALDPERVRGWLASEKRLADYAFYLEDVLRRRPHTLSAAEERIAAEAGNLETAGQEAYNLLANADLPYPTVQLSRGKVRLDPSAYALHRADPKRADRDRVFQAFFGALKGFERTMGATLESQVKAHLFEVKVRGYGSALEAALFRDAIPTSVYRQLVSDVRRNLPTLHRYLGLRKRMLGLQELRYQDLYLPLVGKVDLSFGPEEARAVVLEAVAPLGPEYAAGLKKGFESRWTDYLPSTGKRSGAYSVNTGVYGVHPYQLLNFNGKYDDVSTLAHESGHSMHTFLANATQPYPTAVYPIFVAEVASTLNENLLFHHMLSRARDDATRLALLGNYLDGMRVTLFRQTLFAELELAMHEMAERGEPVTGEKLSARYLDLLRQYYGQAQGVCRVDDLMGIEWAYIAHFYYDFYVYQYATSLVASTSLARAIREDSARGGTAARERYLAMLRAGGSRYPVDLLKQAGVDPTTSAPFDAAMAEMNQVMDEMERILAHRAPATGKR
jgi:oligoendopeptidase F